MALNNEELALAEREIADEEQLKEKINNEEFKIWKKTVPLLYDTIHTQALDFPSLAIKWLPDYTLSENKNRITIKFLFGTNTSGYYQDYLKLGSLELPSTLAPNFSQLSPNTSSIPIPISSSSNGTEGGFQLLSTWKHDGEVNCIRLSPDSERAITFDNSGVIHLFNLQSKDTTDFAYHKSEGYSLEWTNNHRFLSGAHDSQIAYWEVSKPSTPMQLFKSHTGVVNDLSFSFKGENIFGSVADDHTTQFHDIRVATTSENPALKIENKYSQDAIEFHPDVRTLYATGGKDNVVSLYDLRNPSVPFRKFYGHNGSVSGLKWDVSDPAKLVSWALDKRVIFWDLNNLEENFIYPDSIDVNKKSTNKIDPCLSFIHAGHTHRINDFDIHPILNIYSTVGEDHLMEIWKPKTILSDRDEEMEDSEDRSRNDEKEGEEADKEINNDYQKIGGQQGVGSQSTSS